MAIHRKDKMCDIFYKRKELQEEIYLPIPFIMHQRSQMLAEKGTSYIFHCPAKMHGWDDVTNKRKL